MAEQTGKACPHCGSTAAPRRSPSLRVCCDTCYDRLPRDLPGIPKIRSEVRLAYSGHGCDPWELTAARRERALVLCKAIAEHLNTTPPAAVTEDGAR